MRLFEDFEERKTFSRKPLKCSKKPSSEPFCPRFSILLELLEDVISAQSNILAKLISVGYMKVLWYDCMLLLNYVTDFRQRKP